MKSVRLHLRRSPPESQPIEVHFVYLNLRAKTPRRSITGATMLTCAATTRHPSGIRTYVCIETARDGSSRTNSMLAVD